MTATACARDDDPTQHEPEPVPSRTERLLTLAMQRGDRVAAINTAQRLWHPGDLRRTAVVAMHATPAR